MRGLKLSMRLVIRLLLCRIFYRCVDWNWSCCNLNTAASRSHLLQMRGLKQERETVCLFKRESHLLQMRGLKLLLPLVPLLYLSRIFYRCVDWNFFRSIRLNIFRSHLLQMRGLKQMILMIFMRNIWSHLLQMRGLKLISTSLFAYRKLSHLLQMRGLKLNGYNGLSLG